MQSINRRQGIIITINSMASFLLAYWLIFVLVQLTIGFTAVGFEIPVTVFHNHIAYNIKPEAWTFDSVKVLFSVADIVLFLISLTALVIYLKAMELDGYIRLVFLWMFVIAFGQLIGTFIVGAFNYEGMGIVMSYLYLNDTVKMVLLFTGIVVLLTFGFLMEKPYLFSANIYFSQLIPEMRPAFRLYQYFLPYLFSVLIIYLLRMPLSLYEALLLVTPFFLIVPLFWNLLRFPTFYFEDSHKKIVYETRWIGIAIGVMMVSWFVLRHGINL